MTSALQGPHTPNAHTVPVTAIVPTYNRSQLLVEALESILTQRRPPAQILVIDDGSSDDTASAVSRYGDRIEYVRQENAGKSVALNRGLARARQPFVWIFDDDDIAAPDGLQALYEALSADDAAGFAYGLLDQFEGHWPAPTSAPLGCYASDDRAAFYVQLCKDFFLWQGAMLVRKRAFDEVGPFDERLSRSQDYQMALRLARAHRAIAVPEVIFHQRQHAGLRGPRSASVKAHEVERAWTHFNRLFFREIHESHALEEFYVGQVSVPIPPRARVTALLQRSCIMARKGLWKLATADMELAGREAVAAGVTALESQEAAALRVVFEHGARSWFARSEEAFGFARATHAFADPALVADIKGNLLLPITNRARLWAWRPSKVTEARQIALVLAAFTRPHSIRYYFAARCTELRGYRISRVAPDEIRPTGHVPKLTND